MDKHSGRKKMPEKYSVGIACCRIVDSTAQILLVNKRVSYAYYDFVRGKYRSDADSLIRLLSNMTVDEKVCILGFDFVAIWHRIWMDLIPKNVNFFTLKAKFETNFIRDGGKRLKNLIAQSKSIRTIWEIPKGRKEHNESELNCAIREFEEETGINKKKYSLLLPGHRYQTIIDNGVKYVSKYYIAKAGQYVEPTIKILNGQVGEILDARWMNINEVRVIDQTKRLENVIKPILKYVKNNTKVSSLKKVI